MKLKLIIKLIIATTLILVSYLAIPTQAKAKDEEEGLFNKLLAPGPLIKGHRDLEKSDCLKCHDMGKGVPNQKCLACHTDISVSMKDSLGYHYSHRNEACISCHADHKGSDYDSTKVNEKTFKHSETGFELEGKHATIKCAECHTTKRSKKPIRPQDPRFLGATTTCKSCHLKEDVHFFKGDYKEKDCNSCHGTKHWKEVLKFNHFKDTGYALQGKHEKIACKTCHVPSGPKSAKYQWAGLKQKQCLSCHKDQHAGDLSAKFSGGGKCVSCHTQEKWKIDAFQHDITDFDLKGAHKPLRCESCHKQQEKPQPALKDFQFKGLEKTCISCHKDFHGFGKASRSQRYGSLLSCESCHNEGKWKVGIDFNHDVDTRFAIDGKHNKLQCIDCHKTSDIRLQKKPYQNRQYQWANLEQKTCENCHKSPHTKTFSKELLAKKCTTCHTTSDWHRIINVGKGKDGFHHDTTRFPLTGEHAKITCNQCHVVKGKQIFKFANAERKFCVSCHDNVHTQQFTRKFSEKSCAACHNTLDFKDLLAFDHDKTDFKIDGAHKKFEKKCVECHVKTKNLLATKPPVRAGDFQFGFAKKGYCNACHENVHQEQFHKEFSEKSCLDCHNTSNFDKRASFNHDETAFKLKDAHTKVKCVECHKETGTLLVKSPRKMQHRFVFDDLEQKSCRTCHKDVHKGEHGTSCLDCHNENKWGSTRDFHKFFTLTGIHYMARCNECHNENMRLGGLSEQCIACHQDDDIHHGTLPECSTCHSQEFWEFTNFKHAMTQFPLQGYHRILDCNSCHGGGIYEGTPTECLTCHLQDAKSVTFPNHLVGGFEVCSNCHNQFSFQSPTRSSN